MTRPGRQVWLARAGVGSDLDFSGGGRHMHQVPFTCQTVTSCARPPLGSRNRFRRPLLAFVGLASLAAGASGGSEVPLDSIAMVHSLPREVAALAKPALLRGIVTYAEPCEGGDFVIEDESAGIYVATRDHEWNRDTPAPGTLVELRGVTGPGGYAPVLHPSAIKILGKAWLPVAQPVSVSQLLTGRFDSRRVEIRGVVQHATHRKGMETFQLELAGEFGHLSAFAIETGGVEPSELIDAEVTVRGVCFPFFNERAQVVGVRLVMNSAKEVEIKRPPSGNPFDIPSVSLEKLQPFSPDGIDFHRQKISGTVTFVEPGNFLYLQEGENAVRVNLAGHVAVTMGDQLEVVGFPEVKTRFIEWHRAIVRKTGHAKVPTPIRIRRQDAVPDPPLVAPEFRTSLDGRLVSIDGRLENVEFRKDGGRNLFLACDGQVVTAKLNRSSDLSAIDAMRPGSTIRATGICLVDYTGGWPARDYSNPYSMSMLISHAGGLDVLSASSWWTSGRLRIALGASAAVLLVAFAWVRALRREVARQTADLAVEMGARRDAEVEFDATLRERERVAVDLHDTVEQALTGVSYQLVVSEALHGSEPAKSLYHLDMAKQLLAQSREEVRRSVWNLRAQALNGRTLAEAMRDIAAGLSTRNPVKAEVQVIGEEREIPDSIAGHLLLLAQEAMTNAIKHALPGLIRITLRFDADEVELTVADDGAGFEPAHAPGLAEGHLGLQGMRERMKRLGGRVDVTSHPGEGTTVQARVPVPS